MSDPTAPMPPAPAAREPGYTNRQTQILAITVCCMIFPTLVLSLRLVTRLLVKIQLWWDDYCAFAALLFTYGANIAVILTVNPGLGRHMNEVSPSQGRSIIQALFAHQLCWTIGFGLIYCSILFLYIRLFTNTWLNKLSYVLQVVATVWTVLALLILIFQCSPVSRFWDPLQPGHCIKQSLFYTLFGIITMVLITALFFLPTPIIWKLHLSKSRKAGLLIVFCLGAFVCVASVVRVIQVVHPPNEDMTWNLTSSIIWSCLELNIGLMSACIPSLLPLFKMLIGSPGSKRTRSRTNTTKTHHHTRTHHHHHHDTHAPPNTKISSSKFSRMADEEPDEVPLQDMNEQDFKDGGDGGEGGPLPPESSSQTTFEDNVFLVDPKPNEILVTNQIVQSRELKVDASPHSSSASTAVGAGVGTGGGMGVGVAVAMGEKDGAHRYQKTAPPKYSWS